MGVSVIWNFVVIYTPYNQCAKYEHPWSKIKEEFAIRAIRQTLNLFDFCFRGHLFAVIFTPWTIIVPNLNALRQ